MFRAGRYQQRKFVPNFDANTDVSRKDMILEPATELKKSNIEEYEKKLLQHVGKEYPICATCFELYTHDIHGYKYYADREEIATHRQLSIVATEFCLQCVAVLLSVWMSGYVRNDAVIITYIAIAVFRPRSV